MSTPVIDVPSDLQFDDAEIKLVRATNVLRSRFTGRRQALALPYAVWGFAGKVVPRVGAKAAAVRAFLIDLDGQANVFRLPIPGCSGPESGYTGANGSSVGTAAAQAKAIATDGWDSGETVLLRGDYLTVNDELKVATADAIADGSGACTVNFKPPLRSALPSNTEVIVDAPYIYLAADDDEIAKWNLSKPVQHGFSIKALEAIE